MNIVDNIIKYLQVPQVIYKPTIYYPSQLKLYSVEFTYFGRCLHSLGNNFQDVKIIDIKYPNFFNAVTYSITATDNIHNIKSIHSYQEFCNLVGINVLIVGPDDQQWKFYTTRTDNNNNLKPYAILYHSYDDMYYPIISLDKAENYLFYRHNSMILKQLLPE